VATRLRHCQLTPKIIIIYFKYKNTIIEKTMCMHEYFVLQDLVHYTSFTIAINSLLSEKTITRPVHPPPLTTHTLHILYTHTHKLAAGKRPFRRKTILYTISP